MASGSLERCPGKRRSSLKLSKTSTDGDGTKVILPPIMSNKFKRSQIILRINQVIFLALNKEASIQLQNRRLSRMGAIMSLSATGQLQWKNMVPGSIASPDVFQVLNR